MFPRRCRPIVEYFFMAYCLIMLLLTFVSFTDKDGNSHARIVKRDIDKSVNRKIKEELEHNMQPVRVLEKQLHGKSYENSQFIVRDVDDMIYEISADFPLTNGLLHPRPRLRVGSAMRNATFAIGIPSIKREGGDYLFASVHSLLDNLSPQGREDTTIVVFLGEEDDEEYLDQRMKNFSKSFPEEINNGNLEVIAPNPSFYPGNWAEEVKLRFGDNFNRAKWRSKQNLDQVFLMMYVYHLNPAYYLMMEDDILAAIDYHMYMNKAIEARKQLKWFYISFCTLGAIGKLYKRSTLPKYASFIHSFWNVKPLDWIQTDFAKARVCGYDQSEEKCKRWVQFFAPKYHPSLFQHVGRTSSLHGKIQNLKDESFKDKN